MRVVPDPPPSPALRDTLVGGVRWRSRETPGAGDPVVFVHGLLASSASWSGVLGPAGAATGRPTIAVDLPGFGASDRPWPYDYSVEGQVAGLIGFLDARGISRAVVVGNSLGGADAMLLCARHPERVEALVLVSPATPEAPLPLTIRALRARGSGELALALATRPFVAWGLRHRLYARADRVTRDAVDDAWRPLTVPGTRRAALAAIRSPRGAYRGLEDRIHVPTLVVWGERDRLLSAREGRRLTKRIAGARLTIIPDAGHLPQRERPDAFAETVGEFLRSL